MGRIRPAINYIRQHLKGPLVGAEIGVEKGENASSIVGTLDMKKLYLVDIWERYEIMNGEYLKGIDFSKALEGVIRKFEDRSDVEIIIGDSVEVAKQFNKKLDFVYIDSNHNYDSVCRDIANWARHVETDGVVAGHDYGAKLFGVTKAVDEYVSEHDIELFTGGSDWWFRK